MTSRRDYADKTWLKSEPPRNWAADIALLVFNIVLWSWVGYQFIEELCK
jgi:hypothetical protein